MHSISFLFSLVLAAAAARADIENPPQCGGVAYTPCPSGYTCVPQEGGGVCILNSATTPLATPTNVPTATKGLRRRFPKKKTKTTTVVVKSTPTPTPTTVVVNSTPNPTPTGLTTKFPVPTGKTNYSSTPITVKASKHYDCKMARYDRSQKICNGQTEGQDEQAMFVLEPGATLSNCIIGPNQAEGVHCQGDCTLNNVWFEDVCEDAVTFRQGDGYVSYINGGGAQYADDKVLQHDGFGTVEIKNFFVNGYGKLYRSCGNCRKNGHARHVKMNNIYALNGKTLIGINVNYQEDQGVEDTAEISSSFYQSFGRQSEVCGCYSGTNNNNVESIKLDANDYPDLCKVKNVTKINV